MKLSLNKKLVRIMKLSLFRNVCREKFFLKKKLSDTSYQDMDLSYFLAIKLSNHQIIKFNESNFFLFHDHGMKLE